MNTQIKSHWRLARKSLWRAISISFSVCYSSLRARLYSISVSEKIMRQRMDYDKLLKNKIEQYLDEVV